VDATLKFWGFFEADCSTGFWILVAGEENVLCPTTIKKESLAEAVSFLALDDESMAVEANHGGLFFGGVREMLLCPG
jgi:hypothetical protein